jgi:anti-anti-sigma regulatory factor
MEITCTLSTPHHAYCAFEGYWKAEDHRKFRKIFEFIRKPHIMQLTIDLSALQNLPSACIGSLLAAKEEAQAHETDFIIIEPEDEGRQRMLALGNLI